MSAFRASYAGTCWICGAEISAGDLCVFDGDDQVVHEDCW